MDKRSSGAVTPKCRTIDARCQHHGCPNLPTFEMMAVCTSCGAELVVLLSEGHVVTAASPQTCPGCGYLAVVSRGRATGPDGLEVAS